MDGMTNVMLALIIIGLPVDHAHADRQPVLQISREAARGRSAESRRKKPRNMRREQSSSSSACACSSRSSPTRCPDRGADRSAPRPPNDQARARRRHRRLDQRPPTVTTSTMRISKGQCSNESLGSLDLDSDPADGDRHRAVQDVAEDQGKADRRAKRARRREERSICPAHGADRAAAAGPRADRHRPRRGDRRADRGAARPRHGFPARQNAQ